MNVEEAVLRLRLLPEEKQAEVVRLIERLPEGQGGMAGVLADTHAVVWFLTHSDRLSVTRDRRIQSWPVETIW
jgi:hypothetical protein